MSLQSDYDLTRFSIETYRITFRNALLNRPPPTPLTSSSSSSSSTPASSNWYVNIVESRSWPELLISFSWAQNDRFFRSSSNVGCSMLYFGSVCRTADYKRPNKELVRLNKVGDAEEQAYYDRYDMSQGSWKYCYKLYFQPNVPDLRTVDWCLHYHGDRFATSQLPHLNITFIGDFSFLLYFTLLLWMAASTLLMGPSVLSNIYLNQKSVIFSSKFFFSSKGTLHGNKYDYPPNLRSRHLIPSKSASTSRFRGTSRKRKRKPTKPKFCRNHKFKNI